MIMFERRLKILLIFFAIPTAAVAVRLVHLQVLNADNYREAARQMLELSPRQFPFLRGSIVDSHGQRLAYDAPAWDVAVHYGAMVDDPAVRKRMARLLKIPIESVTGERIEESWREIAALTETSETRLREECERIVNRVSRIKQRVSENRGVVTMIEEEMQPHAVVGGLDQSQQVAARVALSRFPWVQVVAGHCRRYEGGASVGHLVGQIGRVTDEVMANDPQADDPLARYGPEEDYGVRGVEALGERWLRGRRGQEHKDRLGNTSSPPIKAQNGRDVQLSLDLTLQQALYARLGAEITTHYPGSTGGCAVVLDLPSRNIVAMVSYPSVEPNNPAEVAAAARDEVRRPFLFRAVREQYSPGSIVKPMLLAGALQDGVIGPAEEMYCGGRLYPDKEGLACTGTHLSIDPIRAVQHSCNVFFYKLGDRLTLVRELWWMSQFGLGQKCGTQLLDESRGHLPSLDKRSAGEALQVGIGQGELEVTPLQAANMTACLATGEYRPVKMWANNPEPPIAPVVLPISDANWRIVREGMYEAVNVSGGTAYHSLRKPELIGSLSVFPAVLGDSGEWVLLGKTGSAQTSPMEWYYTCRFPDGRLEEHRGPRSSSEFLSTYPVERRPTITARRRPPEYDKTHGWFVGYLAPRGRHLQPVREQGRSLAIAVIIEYAGHGGEVAAPVAAVMLDAVLMSRSGQPETAGGGS